MEKWAELVGILSRSFSPFGSSICFYCLRAADVHLRLELIAAKSSCLGIVCPFSVAFLPQMSDCLGHVVPFIVLVTEKDAGRPPNLHWANEERRVSPQHTGGAGGARTHRSCRDDIHWRPEPETAAEKNIYGETPAAVESEEWMKWSWNETVSLRRLDRYHRPANG